MTPNETTIPPAADEEMSFLADGGTMGTLMRSFDWSSSPLGAPRHWPDALKMAVATCLNSRFPMVVWWGPELLMLYNDAWRPILGETKHPQGFARPGKASWPETWPIVGAQFENALKGIASWAEDLLLASDRHGYIEECYFTYSHSPLRDASGKVVGVLSAVSETTAKVLSEHRLRVLRALSESALRATREHLSVLDCCKDLLRVLTDENPDVPFAMLYLRTAGACARLECFANVDARLFPASFCENDTDEFGLIRAMAGARQAIVTTPQVSKSLPGGMWPEPTVELVAVPLIAGETRGEPFGVLLLGGNARLRVNEVYLEFVNLVATQIAAAIATLQGLEREKQAAARNGVLLQELHHRSTNILAVIGTLSRRTLAGSASLEEYSVTFEGRLAAMARALALMSSSPAEGSTLEELIRLETATLSVSDQTRVATKGAPVTLKPDSVQLLALAFHELLTNALNYGALSNRDGTISVSWEREGSVLCIAWLEDNAGRPVKDSARWGLGHALLTRIVPGQLAGSSKLEMVEPGLRWVLEIPEASSEAAGASKALVSAGK